MQSRGEQAGQLIHCATLRPPARHRHDGEAHEGVFVGVEGATSAVHPFGLALPCGSTHPNRKCSTAGGCLQRCNALGPHSSLDAETRAMKSSTVATALIPALAAAFPSCVLAQGGGGDAAELAKELQNPIAALISVPLQSNYDRGSGSDEEGWQYKLNIQPVIPLSISEDWNLISRTILPFVTQDGIAGSGNQTGLGDTVQSIFFSPKAPTAGGWIWGVGPVLLLPTATDRTLGAGKWGGGPTAIVLKQVSGWTYGALLNQIWSFAGQSARADVNAAFVQPFLAYTTAKQTTLAINSESTYDWEQKQWTAPLNLSVAQLLKLGKKPVQFQFGYRYYVEKPENGPKWGLRFNITLLFPK